MARSAAALKVTACGALHLGAEVCLRHFRLFDAFGDESGLPLIPDILRRRRETTRWANSRLKLQVCSGGCTSS